MIIIDWKKMEMDFGPPFQERLTEEEIISICKDNGFKVQEQKEAVPNNYMFLFK